MRKIFVVLLIGVVVGVIWFDKVSSSQAATPTYQETPIAANSLQNGASEAIVYVTLSEEEPPTLKFINNDPVEAQSDQPKLITVQYTGPLPQEPPVLLPYGEGSGKEITTTSVPFEDNWVQLFTENFEGFFPQPGCNTQDRSLDGLERYWGSDSYNPFPPSVKAGWPAKSGSDGVSPATNPYPANLNSWLVCGPFNLGGNPSTEKILVRFDRWLEINDPDDALFVGISFDGLSYTAIQWSGVNTNWRKMNVYFDGVSGSPQVYVSWFFTSDNDGPTGQGAWIDNLEIWRYNTPVNACNSLDPFKGVVVDPYETVGTQTVPIIRSGDTQVVDGLLAADAGLVRMLFMEQNGVVQLQEYDRMFDTLCAQGISVLGVVNQQTLVRQDYNVPATATSYRQEFANTVDLLANHFEGRIYYWEIWNEQDLGPDNPDSPYITPELYAPLLVETHQTLQQNSRPVLLLYGGLSSAWDRSHIDYFEPVYEELRTLGAVGSNSPFKYLAIHPYPDPNEVAPQAGGLEPDVYLHAVGPLPHITILDKFMKTMADPQNGEKFKDVWITEIGWNSAGDDPGAPLTCWQELAVTDQEQATYLKDSFDILFNEVKRWGTTINAVEKVIWYQYRDIGVDDETICDQVGANAGQQTIWERRVPLGYIPKLRDITSQGTIIAWHFGLYKGTEGNKVDPKPARCVFAAYPDEGNCGLSGSGDIFLPIIMKNSSN